MLMSACLNHQLKPDVEKCECTPDVCLKKRETCEIVWTILSGNRIILKVLNLHCYILLEKKRKKILHNQNRSFTLHEAIQSYYFKGQD